MNLTFNGRKAWGCLVLCISFLSLGAQKNVNDRAIWFTDARFGMFIHWGVYSGAEGIWKGEKLRYDNDYAEWIYYRNRISKDEYVTLLKRFDWENIDPEKWVILAKKAGMKYITLTAKHHDGFALWDSQVTDYDIAEYTRPKRDIVKELAEACKKHGLKLGLYYSHWVDWEHPYAWDHSKEIYGIQPEQYDQYWQEKVISQIRELLTNYGDISIMWFDMWVHHSNTVVTQRQLMQLKSLIRELQPGCLVNSRLGLSIEEDSDIDFKTLGDNELGIRKEEFPWQSPATVAHSWGFHALEDQWKSTTTLLHSLINNVSLNGNMMLNIGPRANGDVPHEISQRLLEIGEWLSVNGESIYGSGAYDLPKDQHDWGRITCKTDADGRTKLYLHVFNWPLNKRITVTGITDGPKKVYLLADKQKAGLPFTFDHVVTRIDLPVMQPDPYVSVVVMEYDSYPAAASGLAAETTDGGYSLNPANAVSSEGDHILVSAQHFGSVPAHVPVKQKSRWTWRIYIDRPLTMHADVSYDFQGKAGKGTITVQAAGASLRKTVQPTGKTVGEPNSNWHIDSFNSQRMGLVTFPSAGYYDINLEIIPLQKEEIGFQWLWLETQLIQ
ncbi:MAG: alpha-L-fucosidase [Mangrovibacterium sp.]